MATTIEECRQIVEAQRSLGQGLHDDGDRRLQPRVPVRQGAVRQGRARPASSSSAAATSRTWTAGPTTGRACRRCGTPPTASAPAWRSWASTPSSVVCHGSGRIREELIAKYGSPFAIETATFKIKDSDVVAEVTRSLFDTARQYRESFDAYGSKKSFEWQQVEGEEPVIHTKGLPEPEIPKRVKVPDYAHLLPEPIRRFTTKGVYDAEDDEHLSFIQGGGHGGSHPHLVHAWLSAIRGERPALPDAETSANWTMVGICAHESAMKGGEKVVIPTF